MTDKQHEALMDAYRRASASDADRPSAATRAAILAEGVAAARRQAPAANESRYWLRAVAGIAVLGIGVVLWRQTDYRALEDAPVVTNAPVKTDSAMKAESAPLPESAPKPERAAIEKRTVDSVRADTVTAAPQPFPASPTATPTPSQEPVVDSSPPQLALNTADDELDEVNVTGARIQVPNNERVQGAAAPRSPPQVRGPPPGGGVGGGAPRGLVSTALLREYFPEQYQSEASHSVWAVLNAAGAVLQSGELAPGQSLVDLAPQLSRAFGDRVPGPWQVQTLRNARGQPIEVAVARLP